MKAYTNKLMFCIDNPYTDACLNLAAEEYPLKNFSNDVVKLWQNDLSVIIGKQQNTEAEVNMDFIYEIGTIKHKP